MNQIVSENSNAPLIMQFGTSRFLQAHVDYFIGKSLEAKRSEAAVVVVQSSNNPAGKQRVAAMNKLSSYPVRIQGMQNGNVVDQEEQISAIQGALLARSDWQQVVDLFCDSVTHVVSNTADQGYCLNEEDSPLAAPPQSYPAKLLVLLLARYQRSGKGITLMPCELVANNGDVLKDLVLSLASAWDLPADFIGWLQSECLWINSLVDRIVSESIEPLGAVAEPYALWAIEHQPGLELPCHHDAIRVVDDLVPLEWLKLGVLNLSHSYLVDLWQQRKNSEVETVVQAMHDVALCSALDAVLQDEVIPILKAMQLGEDVNDYAETVRERFLNPFLKHQLSDIAQNHSAKVERRILPLYEQGRKLLPGLDMPELEACLQRNGLISEVTA